MKSNLIRSQGTEKGLERPSRWERTALASGILFVAIQIATIAFTAVFFATTHPWTPHPERPQGASSKRRPW